MAKTRKLGLVQNSLPVDHEGVHSGVFRAEARVWAKPSEAETFALHDAKNMACALHSNIEWLASTLRNERRAPAGDDVLEAIAEALSASTRLSSHLKSALDERRARKDGLQTTPTVVHVPTLIGCAIDRLRRRFEASGVELDVQGSSDGRVMLDRPLISRVLDNLIENALRFSPTGSRVEVHYGRYGQNLVVTVSDSGPGVAAQERERIFGMFQSGPDESPTSTGVGLAFCRSVAEAHGGCLAVEDARGGGACFLLSVPWAEAN